MKTKNRFDADTHRYYINGRPVPSVTQVLGDLLPVWKASGWYLQRGRAVHACAALIAHGKQFQHDERIAGQVAACRKFFTELRPTVLSVEQCLFSAIYQYGGTLDLLARIGTGREVVVDYKSTLNGVVPIQLAAYSLALGAKGPKWGLGVQLNEDGSYTSSQYYALKRYEGIWLALLTAYNVRRELKLKEGTDGQ